MPNETVASPLTLASTVCSLCGGDEAEPIAVGEDFDRHTSPDTYLIVRCSGCGLMYLTPAPVTDEQSRIYAGASEQGALGRIRRAAMRRRIADWGRMLPPHPRVLVVGPGAMFVCQTLLDGPARTWQVEAAEPARLAEKPVGLTIPLHIGELGELDLPRSTYDGAMLIGSLERLDDPCGTLREIGRLLRPSGRVLVMTANSGSVAASVFRGRHWSGYDFPRHRVLAYPTTLPKLAACGGLALEALTTVGDPGAWVLSLRNLLLDWSAPRWMSWLLGPSSLPVIGLADLLERVHRWRGKAGLIAATLRPVPTIGGRA